MSVEITPEYLASLRELAPLFADREAREAVPALITEIEQLREALEPFAKIGVALDAGRAKILPPNPDQNQYALGPGYVCNGDFRRAARLLSRHSQPTQEKGTA